jgi:uncharacterized FlaG/YvyC family protein
MNTISSVRSIGFGILGDMKSGAMELPKGQPSSQKKSVTSFQMDPDMVQQRISKTVSQFVESNDVHLDFEIDHADDKILVKVINKFSGEIVREIPVRPDLKMDMVMGVIYSAVA